MLDGDDGVSYSELMKEGTPFIELHIDLSQPASLVDLVGFFAAIGSQFDQYLRREHPAFSGKAQLFVQEIREGSIIVQLIPIIREALVLADQSLIVDGFVRRIGGLINKYAAGEQDENVTRGDVKDLLEIVGLIANDPQANASISSLSYKATPNAVSVNVKFDTAGAKQTHGRLQRQRVTMELPAFEVMENKMLVFVQTSTRAAGTGRKTALRALIESIHPRALAITYETDLARERIESEIREDERNVYKKGFFVDCYVERLSGKPVAYRLVAVNNIIDLPEDDD